MALTSFVPIQETRHNVCGVLYAGIAVIAFCKDEVLGTRRWLVPIQETRHKAWYFAVAHTTAQTSARLACSFLYPFQRLRKRKLNGYKKTECTLCMHSAKFVVGVSRLVRREPCLRKGSRRNSDCYFVNRVSVSFGRTTS